MRCPAVAECGSSCPVKQHLNGKQHFYGVSGNKFLRQMCAHGSIIFHNKRFLFQNTDHAELFDLMRSGSWNTNSASLGDFNRSQTRKPEFPPPTPLQYSSAQRDFLLGQEFRLCVQKALLQCDKHLKKPLRHNVTMSPELKSATYQQAALSAHSVKN